MIVRFLLKYHVSPVHVNIGEDSNIAIDNQTISILVISSSISWNKF